MIREQDNGGEDEWMQPTATIDRRPEQGSGPIGVEEGCAILRDERQKIRGTRPPPPPVVRHVATIAQGCRVGAVAYVPNRGRSTPTLRTR